MELLIDVRNWLQLTGTLPTGVNGARAVKHVVLGSGPDIVRVYLPNMAGHLAARITNTRENIAC